MPSFKVLVVRAPADLPGHTKPIQAEKIEMESLKFLVQMRSTSHRRVSQLGVDTNGFHKAGQNCS
jgi:hypothetical protein